MKSTQLQLVFNKTDEIRNKIKIIRSIFRDKLEASGPYQKIEDQFQELNARKKQIILGIKGEMQGDLDHLEDLKVDLKDEVQLMSDKALNDYTKGEKVEVVDKAGFICEPLFTVKFKRTDVKK